MILRWFLVIPFALLCSLAAGVVCFILASLLNPTLASVTGETLFTGFWAFIDALFAVDDPAIVVEGTLDGLSELAFTFLVVPPVFAALVGEIIGARHVLWYAAASGILTGAMPWLLRGEARVGSPLELHVSLALGLAGVAAGLVYWMIAGRSAGSAQPAASARPATPD
jgi:NADH:ubiquinone oxidoreductase subunit 6 (subunit J)